MAQSRLSTLRGLAISLLLGATVATGSYAVFSKNPAAKEGAIGLGAVTAISAEGIRTMRRRAKQSGQYANEQAVEPLTAYDQHGYAGVPSRSCCVATEENPDLDEISGTPAENPFNATAAKDTARFYASSEAESELFKNDACVAKEQPVATSETASDPETVSADQTEATELKVPAIAVDPVAESSIPCDLTSDRGNNLPVQDESSLSEPQAIESQSALALQIESARVEEDQTQPTSDAIQVTSSTNKKADTIIVVQLPVMTRSQYRRETSIPQRLKALRCIKWQDTRMLDDGRRVMEGIIPSSQSAENACRQIVIITGSEIKPTT